MERRKPGVVRDLEIKTIPAKICHEPDQLRATS
jgi:hypothetical protein